ncbi:hypothetical protein NA56DRAFT_697304 [Hyaloscypha hepaticicola]|uniref:Uncharacterized protein n=1 Tax=Hyaloscypha hepaticicola TaxID=2082293 RepID=A0A2J6QLJ9_9HELO|nr:hypothetical protein NA56DRAFT_697304 [Hyaloscypha hepaticicola]
MSSQATFGSCSSANPKIPSLSTTKAEISFSLTKYLDDKAHSNPGYRPASRTQDNAVVEARMRAREAIAEYENRGGG